MNTISNKNKKIITVISHFLVVLLFVLIILELLIPGLIIFYLNINLLIIVCLIFSITDLIINS